MYLLLCIFWEGGWRSQDAAILEVFTYTDVLSQCVFNPQYTYASTDEPELHVKLTIEWTDTSNKVHILDDIHRFNGKSQYKGIYNNKHACTAQVNQIT